jgi:hypothetical protein
MSEIETFLDRVCGHLGVPASLKEHIRDELRGHLLEAIETHVAAGVPQERAVAQAIEEFGAPEDVAEGLRSVYGRRLVSVLMEKAMAWKERTLKTGWKWSFVAHAALAALIVAEVLFVAFAVTYIFPLVERECQLLGLEAPPYWKAVLTTVRALHDFSLVLIALAVAAFAIFEWRYRGEHKQTVRLACGGVAALAGMALVAAVSVAMAVPLVMLSAEAASPRTAAFVRQKATEADAAFRELQAAMAVQDQSGACHAAGRFLHALDILKHSPAGIPILACLERERDLDAIRKGLDDVREIGGDVFSSAAQQKGAELEERFARLGESFGRLRASVAGWPPGEGRTN